MRKRGLGAAAGHTPGTRDAALRRLAVCNRWLVAGCTAMTGALTAVAASAFPGKTVKVGKAGATTHSHHRRAPTGTSTTSSSTHTRSLQPPAASPQAASGAAGSGEGSGTGTQATNSPEGGASSNETPPTQQAPPAQESGSQAQEAAAPAQEAVPSQETAPAEAAPEASTSAPETPVVSGGS